MAIDIFSGIHEEFSDKFPAKKVETYKTQCYLRPLFPLALPEIKKKKTVLIKTRLLTDQNCNLNGNPFKPRM